MPSTPVADSDGDGIPDSQELDSDSDGINDLTEAIGEDNLLEFDDNGNGIPDILDDADGDSVPDECDVDVTAGEDIAPADGIDDNCQGVTDTDTDGDGIVDSFDLDADGNGFADFLSTNPFEPIDENEDGIPDFQQGGFALLSPFYLIWNGFLEQTNVAGFINKTSDQTVTATLDLRDRFGNSLSSTDITVPPRGQRDIILNDLAGFIPDDYGSVRVTFSPPGALDGYSAFYRFSPVDSETEFAMVREFENSLTGNSYAVFNNFQPSLNPADVGLQVLHWLQIVNQNETDASTFTVNRYDSEGVLFETGDITIPARGRFDIQAGHEDLIRNRFGLVEVVPLDPTSPYSGELFRYGGNQIAAAPDEFFFGLSDNLSQGESNAQVVSISRTGGGESILEVTNIDSAPEEVQVEAFDSATGEKLLDTILSLDPNQQVHLLSSSFFELGQVGYAKITPLNGQTILAKNTVYFYRTSGSVNSAYTTPARQAISGTVFSHYNTFLGQNNFLKLFNFNAVSTDLRVEFFDIDGNSLDVANISVPSNQGFDLSAITNLNFNLPANTVGSYELSTSQPMFAADNLRFNFSEVDGSIDIGKVLPIR